MFEFLFKYPHLLWQTGEFGFSRAWPVWIAFGLLLLFILLAVYFIWQQKLSSVRKWLVLSLQTLAVCVLLGMLWKPVLNVEKVEAGDNSVAYVFDNSGSMFFSDVPGASSRLESVQSELIKQANALQKTFKPEWYAASDSLQLLNDPEQLPAASSRTVLADSLSALTSDISNQTLAAVVLATDGANNDRTISSKWWRSIKAAGIPIHVVGVGPTSAVDDIELSDVNLVDRAAPNTTVTALLRISHSVGGIARVRIHAGSRLLHAEDLTLDSDQSETVSVVEFDSGEEGVVELTFSLTSDELSEKNTLNNSQPRVLEVAYKPQRILYVEGEPRWEYKFLRRALTNHQEVAIVSLLRTSPNKYYRQGVADENELVDGFPVRREELFAYDAVIIGSLEAAELSTEQQANLRDFVAVRGGSLLMIGGRDGLGDGGWGRSLVSDALPVTLSSRTDVKSYVRQPVTALLTRQGMREDWMRFFQNDADNLKAWEELPQLSDFQKVGSPKPGSVLALSALSDQGSTPLLIWQRYGQGFSYVLATSGTWRWQMRLPSEDQRHEEFWSKFTERLTQTALPRVTYKQESKVLRDADEFSLEVVARNELFEPLEQSELLAKVILPNGTSTDVALIPDLSIPGRYKGAVSVAESGPIKVSFPPSSIGESGGAQVNLPAVNWWFKETGTAEYFGAVQNEVFLKRLASETGGKYLAAADVADLGDILMAQNSAERRLQQLPLWNMPALFLLLLLAKGVEWLLRLKWKRL